MSDYKKGDWSKIWDSLYWRFIHVHQDCFIKNPRMRMVTMLLDKMDKKVLEKHLENAEAFLQTL